jgi:hypothetical protein
MKPYYFALFVALLMTGCAGNDSAIFPGVWQQMDDPTKSISITQTGDNFYFETSMDSPGEGVSGTYNKDKQALEFDNGNGTITTIVYDPATKHIRALGAEFEKTSDAVTDATLEDETTQEVADITAEEETEEASGKNDDAVSDNEPDAKSKCKQGKALVINGDNVRLRTEPDVTKQNILMQLNKGYEVVHLGDKEVSGQKWFNVCYDGNIGWVSGQYAIAK